MSDPVRRGGDDDALERVLVAAQAGAGWAFERLYDHLAPGVTRYLRLQGASDPESLANEVMLAVFQGLSAFDGGLPQLRSWVFTIAHRRGIDDHRRRSARPLTSEFEPQREHVGGDVEGEAMDRISDEGVQTLVSGLTDEQRAVVLLRVVADLSVEEVADLLGKRPGAVKMLQRRGLARLRRIIEREGVTR